MTVVGECMGAGRQDEAIYYVKKLSIIGGGCGDSVLSFHFCPGASNHIFWRDGTGKCVYVHFHAHLHHDCQADCLDVGIYSGVWIRAAGDVRFSMVVSILSMWIFRVSLVMVLVRVFEMGPIAVWIGMFTDWTVRAIVFSVRVKNRKWLERTR